MELHNRTMELDEAQDASQFQATPTTASASHYEEERKELERVLKFQGINRSANMIRFLSFICNKYFEGEADDIRERTVAVEALGRKEANFDSHADPIVRVTASDLRKKLGEFYESEGKDHSLQIILPRGRYIPQFIRRSEQVGVSELVQTPLSGEHVEAVDGPVSETSSPMIGKDEPGNEEPRGPASFSPKVDTKFIFRAVCISVLIAFGFFAGFFLGRHPRQPATVASVPFDWGDPFWSDNFDGQSQQLPDSSKWTYDTGNQSGWGNHEVETYCSPKSDLPKGCDPRHPNAFLDGAGHLVIRAEKNASGVWTSARITTGSLKTFQYGRVEARMKLPVGAGLWPSFWMLGANFPKVGWPSSGSVGMVENVSLGPHFDGLGPTVIRSTLHGPRYSGGNGLWHDFKLPNGERIDDGNFHTYGVIWSPGMMQFYVDDPANIFFVQYASDVPQGGEWVFDHPFSVVMNLAVGGDWPGNPDSTTPNPSEILVDYVRVYKIPDVPAPSIEWDPVRVSAGSATAGIIKLHAKSGAGRVYLSCSTEPATAVCKLTTSVVNFSDSFSQEDSLTISTDSFTEKGRVQAPPGRYKLTITATTISGNRSQLTLPFEVTGSQ